MQSYGECDEHGILIGNLDGGDVVDGAGALRLSAAHESIDGEHNGKSGERNEDNFCGREAALGCRHVLRDIDSHAGADIEAGRFRGCGCRIGGRRFGSFFGHESLVWGFYAG